MFPHITKKNVLGWFGKKLLFVRVESEVVANDMRDSNEKNLRRSACMMQKKGLAFLRDTSL